MTGVQTCALPILIDSPREKFLLDLTGLAPGEHLVVIRAADSANNTGTSKVILK